MWDSTWKTALMVSSLNMVWASPFLIMLPFLSITILSDQLTARFNMDIDEFYNIGGETLFIDRVCAMLNIVDTSRLKIVGIYNGSVTLVAFIE